MTIGAGASVYVQNIHYEIDACTLTSVGVSLLRYAGTSMSFSFACGLTPPGDEQLQIYHTLINGILSPGDGSNWIGSIRLRSPLFIVLNYFSDAQNYAYLTWTTTA